MQIKIVEDVPGELDSMSVEDIAAKLYTGMTRASEQVLKGRSERGGEIDALETLRESLHAGFAARLDAIKAELSENVGKDEEGKA